MASQQSWDLIQILDLVLPTVYHTSFVWCVPAQLSSSGGPEVLPVVCRRLFPLPGYLPLFIPLLLAPQTQPAQPFHSPDDPSGVTSPWEDFP